MPRPTPPTTASFARLAALLALVASAWTLGTAPAAAGSVRFADLHHAAAQAALPQDDGDERAAARATDGDPSGEVAPLAPATPLAPTALQAVRTAQRGPRLATSVAARLRRRAPAAPVACAAHKIAFSTHVRRQL